MDILTLLHISKQSLKDGKQAKNKKKAIKRINKLINKIQERDSKFKKLQKENNRLKEENKCLMEKVDVIKQTLATISPMKNESKIKFLKRVQGDKCSYCSKKLTQPTCEHLWPRSRGGPNHFLNIVLTCKKCNGDRADRIDDPKFEKCLIDRMIDTSDTLRLIQYKNI